MVLLNIQLFSFFIDNFKKLIRLDEVAIVKIKMYEIAMECDLQRIFHGCNGT